MDQLQNMPYTKLYVIKYSNMDQICEKQVICFDVDPSTVQKLADAVISGRKDEDNAITTNINRTISISSAIIAILSFILSTSSAIITIRSRKSTSA